MSRVHLFEITNPNQDNLSLIKESIKIMGDFWKALKKEIFTIKDKYKVEKTPTT